MNLALKAMLFARQIYKDQRRKYTNALYFDHLAEVAGIAMTVGPSRKVSPTVFQAVCWLHDSKEDQGVTHEALVMKFGEAVANGVHLLTDDTTGNRATRKMATARRLASAPDWVQTIKCADIISNAGSILLHNPDFGTVYIRECVSLLDVMHRANANLRKAAFDILKV